MIQLLLVLLVFLPSEAVGADWHVAPDGADDATGDQAAPLATLGEALARAEAGDRVLLQRDGTYFVNGLQVNDVEINSYGSGASPVLTSSVAVELPNTWASNGNVLSGPVSNPVLACYVDGRFVRLARYPNNDFLRVDNDDDPDRIVDSDLALRPGVAAGRWTGAQVRWRRWSWWWETRPIVEHSATDTLLLGPENRSVGEMSDAGSGYFIDGDLDELDAPGEWMWADGTLYVYPPTWADPASMRVEVVTSDDPGVYASGASFSDVQMQRFAGTAVKVNGASSFERCTFAEIETNAISTTWNAQPLTVRRCIFRDVRNSAIRTNGNPAGPGGTVIERNLFLRIGTERGYGGSGAWHAAGVVLGNENGAVVRLNRFVETGYAGIILGSDGQTVERNVFVRTMATLNDGAAIYTNCNASIIRENIILDTLGDLETSHPWYPLGHGIWPEFLSDFADSVITDNTIYGSNGFGLFVPNNFTCTISGNIAVDNRRAGLDLSGDAGDNQAHSISGNTLAAVAPSRRLVRPENLSQWWLPPYGAPTTAALTYEPDIDYGDMTDTTFIAAESDTAVIRPKDGAEIDNVNDWIAAEPDWAGDGGSRVVRANAILLFNDTEVAANVPVPAGEWTFPDGSMAGSSVALDPFRSVVLVTAAAVPSEPPYYAASGIDWRAQTPVTTVLGEEPGPLDDGAPTDGAPVDGAGHSDGGPVSPDGHDQGPGGDDGPLAGDGDKGSRAEGISGGCSCRAGTSAFGPIWLIAIGVLCARRRGQR